MTRMPSGSQPSTNVTPPTPRPRVENGAFAICEGRRRHGRSNATSVPDPRTFAPTIPRSARGNQGRTRCDPIIDAGNVGPQRRQHLARHRPSSARGERPMGSSSSIQHGTERPRSVLSSWCVRSARQAALGQNSLFEEAFRTVCAATGLVDDRGSPTVSAHRFRHSRPSSPRAAPGFRQSWRTRTSQFDEVHLQPHLRSRDPASVRDGNRRRAPDRPPMPSCTTLPTIRRWTG